MLHHLRKCICTSFYLPHGDTFRRIKVIPLSTLGALFGYMTICSFTPGPGNILSMTTMTSYGWQRGKILLFGIFTGYFVVQLICALGVYMLGQHLMTALNILKYVGAVYMLWLTVHIIRSKPYDGNAESTTKPSFWTGMLLQLVNVKIFMYGITAITGYIAPYNQSLFALVLTELIIAGYGCIASLAWAYLGLKIQKWYSKYYKPINWILGIFLLYCTYEMIR